MPAMNHRAMRAVAGFRKPPKNEPAGDAHGRRPAHAVLRLGAQQRAVKKLMIQVWCRSKRESMITSSRMHPISGRAMRVHFSTDGLQPRDREQFWLDFVSKY